LAKRKVPGLPTIAAFPALRQTRGICRSQSFAAAVLIEPAACAGGPAMNTRDDRRSDLLVNLDCIAAIDMTIRERTGGKFVFRCSAQPVCRASLMSALDSSA